MAKCDDLHRTLREALNHLYDPDFLRRSPLAACFGVADRYDTPRAVQRILTDAIVSLRPTDSSPATAEAWTVYEVLFYRYVQQVEQQEVADQLGYGVRHLRRKQRKAIELLSWRLAQQYGIEPTPRPPIQSDPEQPLDGEQEYDIEDELAWLEDAQPVVLTDVTLALRTAVSQAQLLAEQVGKRVISQVDDALPALLVHPVVFRQIVLNVLSYAIHSGALGTVTLTASKTDAGVAVRIAPVEEAESPKVAAASESDNLALASRMIKLCGGEILKLGGESPAAGAPAVELRFAILQRTPVLALDDNEDFLQLLGRYAADTQYRVVPTRDPDKALQLASSVFPSAVLLDVMMPDTDGWEVLARLRQHPTTRHLPIIVCTILAQKELSLALGADAFLRKPITQQELIAVLDTLLEQKAPGSR